jgi:hypothetical protein
LRKGGFAWLIIFLLIIFAESFFSQFLVKNFVGSFILVFLLILIEFLKISQKNCWKFLIGGGILTDLFLFTPLGFHALIFFLSGLTFFYLKDKVFSQIKKSVFFSLFFSIFLVIIVNQILVLILYHLFSFLNLKNSITPYFFNNWLDFFYSLIAYIIFYTMAYTIIKKVISWLNIDSSTLFIKR